MEYVKQMSILDHATPHREHDPDSRNVLRVLHNFHSQCMPHLVALSKENLLACFIRIDVLDHPVRVKMNKLYRERLKRMSFRHVVLNPILEFFLCEPLATNSLKLVVRNRS